MRIGPILKKIQGHLTEEEMLFFMKELEKSPDKLLKMISPMPTSSVDEMVQRILGDIKKGMMEYGRYHYYDKGVDSVMNIEPYLEDFRKRDKKEVQEILLKLCSHEHGKKFASTIVACLDDLPREQWDELMSHPRMADLY